jgi:ankyrin repeat protein
LDEAIIAGKSLSLIVDLIARGAWINAPDRLGYTPLHFAVTMKNAGALRALLRAGAREVPNKAGATPHRLAVTYGLPAIATMLKQDVPFLS